MGVRFENIIFDIGMVLVDFCYKEYMESLGFSKETIAQLEEGMILSPLWNEMDRGEYTEEELILRFKERLTKHHKEIDCFFENPVGLIKTFPDSAQWLTELKERNYSIYLLSNYPEREFKMHSEQFDFLPYVDGKIISYEVKMTKPDVRIYKALLEKYGLQARECIFLDDKPSNIKAAESLGIKGLVVTSQEQARVELNHMLEE